MIRYCIDDGCERKNKIHNEEWILDYIKYVDDHDCWKCQLLDSKYFFLGISSKKHDALDRVWEDLRENLFDVSYFVSKGITIWEYLESIYKQAQKTGYEVTINDIKAFVINYFH